RLIQADVIDGAVRAGGQPGVAAQVGPPGQGAAVREGLAAVQRITPAGDLVATPGAVKAAEVVVAYDDCFVAAGGEGGGEGRFARDDSGAAAAVGAAVDEDVVADRDVLGGDVPAAEPAA